MSRLVCCCSSGRSLYTPIQSPAVHNPSDQATVVDLAPGAKGLFWVDFHSCPGAPTESSEYLHATLRVKLVDVSGVLSVPWSTSPACAAQRIGVSAVVPGVITSAPGFSTGGSPPRRR